jgi:hypothetical protein
VQRNDDYRTTHDLVVGVGLSRNDAELADDRVRVGWFVLGREPRATARILRRTR